MCCPGGIVVKDPPANVGDAGDLDQIRESGRAPGVGNDCPLQYSCWRIPWTEEPGSLQKGSTEELLQSMGLQRVGHD